MLKEVKAVAPHLFEKAGPPCLRGACPRGRCPAGKWPRCGKHSKRCKFLPGRSILKGEEAGLRKGERSHELIVLEGLDGSGKGTQTQLLFEELSQRGKPVRKVTFPDYQSPSSSLVKMYLNGEFGAQPEDVNAYAASAFYAVDRFASFRKAGAGTTARGSSSSATGTPPPTWCTRWESSPGRSGTLPGLGGGF